MEPRFVFARPGGAVWIVPALFGLATPVASIRIRNEDQNKL